MTLALTPDENDILNSFFNVNDEIKLNKENIENLQEIIERVILEGIEEHGTQDKTQIKEKVMDVILENDLDILMKYLNLELDDEIEQTLLEKLEDPEFSKVEESENNSDFFTNYLQDDTINDLIMSLKGFERKAEGSKEIFLKKRKALIPNARIDAIKNILTTQFNKTNFLSQKDDIEQARLILFAYSQIFEIVLETPYICCDVQKTIEVLSMCSLKLSNLIGLSEGFRNDLLDALKESFKSIQEKKEKEQRAEVEE